MTGQHDSASGSADGDPGPAGLIARIAQGDESALSALYDATVAKVHALARIMAKDDELAGDVTRETYLQVWRHAHTYDPQACSPLAWVLGLTRYTGLGSANAA